MPSLSTLQADIFAWTNVQTYTLTQVEQFARFAIAEINTKLRVRDMTKKSSSVVTGKTAPLPADFVAFERVRNGDAFGYINYVSYDQLELAGSGSGDKFYTIEGNEIIFSNSVKFADGKCYYTYYAEIVYDVNLLFFTDKYYNILLNLCIAKAAELDIEDDRAASWTTKAYDLMSAHNNQHLIQNTSGSKLVMRTR